MDDYRDMDEAEKLQEEQKLINCKQKLKKNKHKLKKAIEIITKLTRENANLNRLA